MKKIILNISLAIFTIVLVFTSCKESKIETSENAYNSDAEASNSLNDMYTASSTNPGVDGTSQTQNPPKTKMVSNSGPRKLADKYEMNGKVYKASEVNRIAIYEPECLEEKNPMECSSYEIYDFMVKNITYPKDALNESLETVSIIQFVVDKNGRVSDTKFLNYNGTRCVSCEKAALQAFGKMHNWVPAQKDGRDVAVEMTLPVRFNIEES